MKELTSCLNCGQAITNPAATICYSCGHNLIPADAPSADNARKPAITQFSKWTPLTPARTRPATADFMTSDVRSQAQLPTRCRSVVPASRTMLEILLATTMALATLTAIMRPKTNAGATPAAAPFFMQGPTKAKWDRAARELSDIGADVQPYSAEHPNLMAVQLRPGIHLSKSSALNTAECAHAILGPFALVTLRDASGKVIAIANY